MTSDLFKTWLNKLDRKMTLQGRKILLIVDNCPAHPNVTALQSIELYFLPPNCTSVLQPMDQGIIRNYKFHYRKLSLQTIIDHMETHNHKPTESLNVLQAIRYTKKAWDSVSAECISNCFKHGFYGSSAAAPIDDDIDTRQDEIARLVETAHGADSGVTAGKQV